MHKTESSTQIMEQITSQNTNHKIEESIYEEKVLLKLNMQNLLSAINPYGQLVNLVKSELGSENIDQSIVGEIKASFTEFDKILEKLMPKIYSLECSNDGKIEFQNLRVHNLSWDEINHYCTVISNNWNTISDDQFSIYCDTLKNYKTDTKLYTVNRFTLYKLLSNTFSDNALVAELVKQVSSIESSVAILISEYNSKATKTEDVNKIVLGEQYNNQSIQEQEKSEKIKYSEINIEFINQIVKISEELRAKIEKFEQVNLANSAGHTKQSWLLGEYGIKKFSKYKAIAENPNLHTIVLKLKESILTIKANIISENDESKKIDLSNQVKNLEESLEISIGEVRVTVAKILSDIRKLNKLFEKIVSLNKKLVYSVLKKYFFADIDKYFAAYKSENPKDIFFGNTSITIGEVLNNANYAIIEAVLKFDPNKTSSFSTYTYFLIRNSISSTLNKEGYNIYVPTNKRSFYNKIIKMERALKFQFPDLGNYEIQLKVLEQVNKNTNYDTITLAELFKIKEVCSTTISTDAKYKYIESSSDESETAKYTSITDNITSPYPEPIQIAQEWDLCELTTILLEELNPRERKVIIGRHYNKQTQSIIGEELNVSAERIRQIEEKALKKLRKPIRSFILEEYKKGI